MGTASDVLKGGWHPKGDPSISRKTWKSDLKGLATGRKDDAAVDAQNHASTPLSSLKDPDSFGPPPKHSAYYGDVRTSAAAPVWTSASGPSSPGPATPARSNATSTSKEDAVVKEPPGPYKVDTTGLRTDNLPKPPIRRDGNSTPVSATVARAVPSLPVRKATGPPPALPPRQNENPHEHTPAAPPSYGEAIRPEDHGVNSAAVDRLGRAGINVPGLDIGNPTSSGARAGSSQMGHSGQLSELQQRFARMNSGPAAAQSQGQPLTNNGIIHSAATIASAKKKPPPPPPVKRSDLTTQSHDTATPPPLPLSSKPKPG